MQNNYASNLISGMVRDCARNTERVFNAVPVSFGDGTTNVTVKTDSYLIVAVLEDCPMVSCKEFLEFVDNLFGRLHGYRVSLRFTGTHELLQFANAHLTDIYSQWQCRFDTRLTGGYVLEVFRLRHQKK